MVSSDANLLLYAYDLGSPHHREARAWLEAVFASGEEFGIPVQALLAFIRIGTSPALPRPFTMEEALSIVDTWMIRPQVRLLAPGLGHWRIFREIYLRTGATGRLSTDIHLAALAIEHRAIFYSADHDFARFPGLLWRNPLSPVAP